MAIVSIKLAPLHIRRDLFVSPDVTALVTAYLHIYIDAGKFVVPQNGEDAAEEAYDVTNNPSREDERFSIGMGEHRPVCVGDVVQVMNDNGRITNYVCNAMGWTTLASA